MLFLKAVNSGNPVLFFLFCKFIGFSKQIYNKQRAKQVVKIVESECFIHFMLTGCYSHRFSRSQHRFFKNPKSTYYLSSYKKL